MRDRPRFKLHDDFNFEPKKIGSLSRQEFIRFVRESHEHMRQLSSIIERYGLTLDEYLELFEENELTRESAETVRVSNEEERISKDSERDSKIEGLQSDFDSLDNLFHGIIETDSFKVISCSLSDLDNIRELYFEETPHENISYIAITNNIEALGVWGAERKTPDVDNRFQLRLRTHAVNYFQSRAHDKNNGWGDWVTR